jgi:spermidine synthase
VNRDLYPICYYYNLVLWLSMFYPQLRAAFESAGYVTLWWVALPLAAITLLLRLKRGWAVPAAVGAVGLAEMVLEILILMGFQALHGYVYAEIGLIVAAFMGGLAIGAWTGTRRLARPVSGPRAAKRLLLGALMGLTLGSAVILLLFSLPVPVPAAVFPLLGLLLAFAGGMAFPAAVAMMPGWPGTATGSLYGADLAGGCAGALLGALLFVPILGIPQTCAAVALIGLAGLVALA